MEIVMHKHLAKHDNYQPGNPFSRSCSDAWKSRKALRKHARAVAALNDHILYDIGELDLRFWRSALPALNSHKLLVGGVFDRDSVEFDPRR